MLGGAGLSQWRLRGRGIGAEMRLLPPDVSVVPLGRSSGRREFRDEQVSQDRAALDRLPAGGRWSQCHGP